MKKKKKCLEIKKSCIVKIVKRVKRDYTFLIKHYIDSALKGSELKETDRNLSFLTLT